MSEPGVPQWTASAGPPSTESWKRKCRYRLTDRPLAVVFVVLLVGIAMALGGCGGPNGDHTSPAAEIEDAEYKVIYEKIDTMISYQNALPHLVEKLDSRAAARFHGYRRFIEEWAAANSIDPETEVLCEKAAELARAQIALHKKPNDSIMDSANSHADVFNEAWRSWLDSHPWVID